MRIFIRFQKQLRWIFRLHGALVGWFTPTSHHTWANKTLILINVCRMWGSCFVPAWGEQIDEGRLGQVPSVFLQHYKAHVTPAKLKERESEESKQSPSLLLSETHYCSVFAGMKILSFYFHHTKICDAVIDSVHLIVFAPQIGSLAHDFGFFHAAGQKLDHPFVPSLEKRIWIFVRNCCQFFSCRLCF